MVDTSSYFILGVNQVFSSDPSKQRIANKLINQHSSDVATLTSKLDALCG